MRYVELKRIAELTQKIGVACSIHGHVRCCIIIPGEALLQPLRCPGRIIARKENIGARKICSGIDHAAERARVEHPRAGELTGDHYPPIRPHGHTRGTIAKCAAAARAHPDGRAVRAVQARHEHVRGSRHWRSPAHRTERPTP